MIARPRHSCACTSSLPRRNNVVTKRYRTKPAFIQYVHRRSDGCAMGRAPKTILNVPRLPFDRGRLVVASAGMRQFRPNRWASIITSRNPIAISSNSIDARNSGSRIQVQVSPYVTLGAPQVGHDPVATQWARQRFAEIKSGKKTEDEFLESMKGYFALALVPPCDGLPWYTNGKAGYVEICSFRAEWIILECRSIIPRALADNCYKSCLPPEFEALGKALRQIAKQYSSENSAQHVEALRELPETSSVAGRRSHILFSAAKWCHWWSSRGHGLEAYA